MKTINSELTSLMIMPGSFKDYCLKNYRINISLAVFCGVILSILLIIAIKVFKIVKFNQKILLAMILFLILEIMCKFASTEVLIICFIAKIVFYVIDSWLFGSEFKVKIDVIWFTILPMLPVAFLSIAAILNVNNWVRYFFKIGEMAQQ